MASAELNRWFYRGGRPNAIARRINAAVAWATAQGLVSGPMATLEVTGRRSGQPRRLPVVVVELGDRYYLVSMLGERVGWVRDVRAAGHRAALLRNRRTDVLLEEVPVAQRAPILKRYCQVATSGRDHFPLGPEASVEEFAAIAEGFPVFLVRPL